MLMIHTYIICVLRLPGIALQIKFGVKLLKLVRGDLLDVIHVCETKLKQTNYLRSLISDLVKGTYVRVHAECQMAVDAQYKQLDKSMFTYIHIHTRVRIGLTSTEHSASNRIAVLDPSQLVINAVHTSTGTIFLFYIL